MLLYSKVGATAVLLFRKPILQSIWQLKGIVFKPLSYSTKGTKPTR